ncbi:hypothetical protein Bsph_0867 [Lysinibacillus sphaericus C3-41]|uniref:Uncharacterized protein n=1 Tax=Lysinibacillus sphaericus (strain C3-41) TaxID=444177 RepID=B1HZ83_LYSSC|nr:hypothetical protein Bsph_0867 [Lysinibacillus sphaericus C3-41]
MNFYSKNPFIIRLIKVKFSLIEGDHIFSCQLIFILATIGQ